MAILTVRNLPDEVHRALRIQAAHNGRSMEAEARKILESAVMQQAVRDTQASAPDDEQLNPTSKN